MLFSAGNVKKNVFTVFIVPIVTINGFLLYFTSSPTVRVPGHPVHVPGHPDTRGPNNGREMGNSNFHSPPNRRGWGNSNSNFHNPPDRRGSGLPNFGGPPCT